MDTILPSPGSAGHPELCSRPCLFFVLPGGQCENGSSCEFCHLSHHKIKTINLDKRHRDMMKQMDFSDCVLLALPILKDRVLKLRLSPEVLQRLGDLGVAVRGLPTSALARQAKQERLEDRRTLVRALRAISLRALFLTLRRLLPRQHQYEETAEALRQTMAAAGILTENL